MNLHARLDVLVAVAEQIGLTVRREHLGGDGGGFCLLKNRRILFVDQSADVQSRYERTLAALAPMPEIDDRWLPPQVREDIEQCRQQSR